MELQPPAESGRPRLKAAASSTLWIAGLLWLLLLCWLAFFNNLGSLGLMDKTEALFVEVGHQMLQRGDWITPWWNGERFFDYPVWGYWMVGISFRLFGVSEWAARFPVALSASAVVVTSFVLMVLWSPSREDEGRRFGRAALASGVLATTPGWIGWGRTSTTDMFLSSAITLALFSFLLAHRHADDPRFAVIGRIGLGLFSGIAVLAKGPIGLIIPALVIGVFLIITGRWERWLRPRVLLGVVGVFLGVCLPWYVAATQVNGIDFLWGFLGFSNLQRFTSVIYNHPGPPWFYLPWLILLVLPWSLFLPVAIGSVKFWRVGMWRSSSNPQHAEHGEPDPLPLFLVLWLLLTLALFSAAATKLPGYILPALPACSLLVVLYWRPFPHDFHPARQPQSSNGSGLLRLTGWINALLLTVMAAAAVMAPDWVANDPAYPDFAASLNRSGLPLTLAILLGLMAIGLVLLLQRPKACHWLWVPNLAGFLAVLALVIAPLAPLLDRERQLPLRQLASRARELALPQEPLWVVGTKRYSILFYSGQPAVFLSGRESIDNRLRADPTKLGLQADSPSVRLLGDRDTLAALNLPGNRVERLERRGEQELWRVPIVEFKGP